MVMVRITMRVRITMKVSGRRVVLNEAMANWTVSRALRKPSGEQKVQPCRPRRKQNRDQNGERPFLRVESRWK